MKGIWNRFKGKFGRYSMRTKLALSFSAMIAAVFIVILLSINGIVSGNYREKIIHSAAQSYDQAYSFLDSRIQSMIYVSDLLYYNGDLQGILSSSEFTGDRTYPEQFREFLKLENVFQTLEFTDTVYQTKIYISDEIEYSNNGRHISSMEQLKGMAWYEDFVEKSAQELYCFTPPEMVQVPGISYAVELVSLLRTVKSTDGRMLPIAVEQVSAEVSHFQEIIDKSNITDGGLVYLCSREGAMIASSETGAQLLEKLEADGALPDYEPGLEWESRAILGEEYLMHQSVFPQADWILVALVPVSEIEEPGIQMVFAILLLFIGAILLVFFLSFLLARYYTSRIRRLADMMEKVEHGMLDIEFGKHTQDEIGQLFSSFEYMAGELKKLMHEQYLSGKKIKSAQFIALQAQINPHFLYNTLDLINWKAMDNEVPEIAGIARNLAKFYRLSLNKGSQITTVEAELEHVRAYTDIQNQYFDGAITLKTQVPEHICRRACLNIILQPFVENSIMHGIASDASIQECNITIRGRECGDRIILEIEDDGLGMDEETLRTLLLRDNGKQGGYGIYNIHERIRLCYGGDCGLSFTSEKGRGTTVTIRIGSMTVEEARDSLPGME